MQTPRLKPSNTSRGAWGAALLLAPHLLLGTWLMVVPDHLAFRASQVVTLVHVLLASSSLPFVVVWVVRHARRPDAAPERRPKAAVGRRLLALATTLTACTGLAVVWGGDIIRLHLVHAVCGLAVGALLSWHLAAARQRLGASLVAGLMVIAVGGAGAARRGLPPQSLAATVPPFAYETKPASSYERAEECGACHVDNYADWKRSTHGRTMQNPLIRDGFARQKDSVGFDLRDYAKIIGGAPVAHANEAFNACEMCHAPTSFYGDDRGSALDRTGTAAEGVTCSFCHTLRAVEVGQDRGKPIPKELAVPARSTEFLPLLPKYVSAPESVRRYFGQGSSNHALRLLANALIRWRPDVHRQDYHAPVLDQSLGCMPCHSLGGLDMSPDVPQKTYRSWETSRYATTDPATTVTCQDCHMARKLTGARTQEAGSLVPWGPVRARNGSHLFLGGNRTVATLLDDPALSAAEHELNLRIGRVVLMGTRRDGARLDVDVRVESLLVGHDLPSMGAQNRWLWVEIIARDASGRAIGTSRPPKGGDDVGGESPVMFHCIEHPSPACDTALQADVARFFTAHVTVDPGADVVTVQAVLHVSVDDDPIAEDTRRLPFLRRRAETPPKAGVAPAS